MNRTLALFQDKTLPPVQRQDVYLAQEQDAGVVLQQDFVLVKQQDIDLEGWMRRFGVGVGWGVGHLFINLSGSSPNGGRA